MGRGQARRIVRPAADDFDVARRFAVEALASAASSSPSVVTLAVNQPWQPRAAGRA